MKKALIIIDFINEIIHKNGKLAGKGYSDFVQKHGIIENTNQKIADFRSNSDEIIFVNLSFKNDYSNQPKNSPLFGKAHEFGILIEKSRGTKVHKDIEKQDTDTVFIKTRVSAFYKTDLEKYLQEKGISDVYFCGCATDLAIESAVRDAHDRDFTCFVLENCCAAADEETHQNSIETLSKIATIIK